MLLVDLVNALLDVSHSETVGTLIEQGFYLEARDALREWERRFPLSKISSDFILQEAKLYIALEDYKRARRPLEAYFEHVDASSFTADAAECLFTCMIKMKEPQSTLQEFYEKAKKRLEFHPIAAKLEKMLRNAR